MDKTQERELFYEIIVDISNSMVDRVFDYTCSFDIELGSRVKVPFGNRSIEGFVIGKKTESLVASNKLKSVIEVLDKIPSLTSEMLLLAKFLKNKYNLRMVDCLRLFIPSQMRNAKVKELNKTKVRLVDDYRDKLSGVRENAVNQWSLIEHLESVKDDYTAEINKSFGSAVKVLIKKEIVELFEVKVDRTPYKHIRKNTIEHTLSVEQAECITKIQEKTGKYLIFGVTGSGKTEVYLRLIERVLREGKTAIMLVPEISLTPNMLTYFRGRFDEKVAIIHSGLSAGERFDEWNRLRSGQASVAIGARSAVFAPLSNVGVIIIDEEHDSSYQSETNPRYNTIEVATKRAEYNKCSLVLGSATPSLESYYKATHGEYELLQMTKRAKNQSMPDVEIVDMTLELFSGNKSIISNKLKSEMDETLKQGNQVILFLNRRGYSSFMMCNSCGYVAKCQDCDITLTYHKDEEVLKCHYCGKKYKPLDVCPNCKNQSIRQGKVGTQQIVNLLSNMYPDIQVLRMDYDTMNKKDAHSIVQEKFRQGEAQILVGTQMVTKGHDFPRVTLVGILDSDQSLYYGDYRSNERTFQLITQVAGRSGRDKLKGKVIMQTYTPRHFALQFGAKQDYVGFYNKEIYIREASKFPPFCSFVRLLYSSEDSQQCIEVINEHFDKIVELRKNIGEEYFIFLQKMRSPIKRIESKHRFQILIRIDNSKADEIIMKLYEIANNHTADVNVFVELNPQNLS